MTDKEIIKALECCTSDEWDICDKCPYQKYKTEKGCAYHIVIDALDLINRQQAEIERLTINMNAFGLGMKREKERADTTRAEAIKEYKNKVENDIVTLLGKSNCTDFVNCLDYRYKEMVGK